MKCSLSSHYLSNVAAGDTITVNFKLSTDIDMIIFNMKGKYIR